MISVVITSRGEVNSVEKVAQQFLKQIKSGEVIVVAPEKIKLNGVQHIRDKGLGKPAALNLAFMAAKHDILILTDGDVLPGENAVEKLLEKFVDKRVGVVSGRPIPMNSKDNVFGYWAHLLTEVGAHRERLYKVNKGGYIPCSGYLMAIRNVLSNIPENALSDDAVITYKIWKQGYRISYAPEAKVYVKYPDNWKDWIKQKRRSIGGYAQFKEFAEINSTRNILTEAIRGTFVTLTYAKTAWEFIWSAALIFARLYVWGLSYWDKISRKQFKQIWLPVESTKRWN
jgi:cellulose synthase/poly-beta-1,6-N-acetylglucosamine synthase-like glycosyltransferase